MATAIETRPSEFLRALYGEWERGYLVLWRSDDRASMCLAADELDAANKWVDRNRKGKQAHSYYGLGLQPERLPATERGVAERTIAIPGIWCDLDFAEAAAAKKATKKYPPRELAERCLAALPFPPSVVVLSGGGLHPYWLFHELHYFDDAGRVRVAAMVQGWHRLIAEQLRKLGGYELDATADLARVMRLPGSWNFRAGTNVQLAEGFADPDFWRRYEPADFEPFLAAEDPKIQRVEYRVGEIVLDDSRDIGASKLDVLKHNFPELAACLFHTGRTRYPSNSERELALASYAVQAGWTDQQIADLLIYHRRKWEPDKLGKLVDRADYVPKTIAKARGEKNRDAAIQTLNGNESDVDPSDHGAEQATPVGTAETGEDVKEKTRKLLSSVFGVTVEQWVQFSRERPIYSLVLTGGIQVRIGGVGAVLDSEKAIRQAIYAQTGYVMPPVGKRQWAGIAEALSRIVTVKDSKDASDAASVVEGFKRYMQNKKSATKKKMREALVMAGESFIDDGWAYIRPEDFFRWMNMHSGKKWEKTDLFNVMDQIGFEQSRPHYINQETGNRSTKSYQRCDLNKLGDDAPASPQDEKPETDTT